MDGPAPASENTNTTIVETGKVMSQNGTRPIGSTLVFTFDDQYKSIIALDTEGPEITPFLSRPVTAEISATVKDSEA